MAAPLHPRLLSASDSAYRLLLRVYPAGHRREYGPLMAQLFRDLCRDAARQSGAWGLAWLWARTLLDAARTALIEHVDERKRARGSRGPLPAWRDVMETTALDRQLSDLIYLLVKALRSGYSLRQIVGVMAESAPEPASSALRGWQADLEAGRTQQEALANLRAAWPSPYLAQIIEAIVGNQESGGNLVDQLAPCAEQIYQAVGSDEAFYPEMRRQAASLGGPLPERVRST